MVWTLVKFWLRAAVVNMWCWAGVLVFFLWAMMVTAPRMEKLKLVSERTGEEFEMKRPWVVPLEKREPFWNGRSRLVGEMRVKGWWAQKTMGIELRHTRPNFKGVVAGREVQFTHYQIVDPFYDQFFFKRYVLDGRGVKGGVVPFEFFLENEIKDAPGVWLRINFWDPVFLILWVGAVGSAAMFMVALFRRFGAPLWGAGLVMGALMLVLAYLRYTKPHERTYDEGYGPGVHSAYVMAIVERGRLPKVDEGFVFYHAPFYYLLGAAVWWCSEVCGAPNPYQALQVLAVVLFGLYLAGGVLAIFQLVQRPGLQALAAAVFCFWPGGIMHSIRLGNDALLYALSAWGIFLGFRWWRRMREEGWSLGGVWRGEWVWSALCAAAAFYAKSNGLVLVGWLGMMLCIVCVGMVYREAALLRIRDGVRGAECVWKGLRRMQWGRYLRCLGVLLGVTALFVGLYLARNLKAINFKDPNFSMAQALVPNAGALNPGMWVETNLRSFLVFDPFSFMSIIYTNPYNEEGKKHFWNYLFKTSLFGEYGVGGRRHDDWAWWLNFNFVLLLGMVVYGLVRYVEADWWEKVPVYTLIVLYFASMIYFRMKVHYGCANEFRYILPVLVPMAMVIAEAATRGRTGWRIAVKVGLCVMFVVASIVYWGMLPERF
ncbi:MAG: hypothetical protein RML49_02445 [Verrucomicrobiae bacterium]|nr:hypothetical protein [Verrucomicrobiae bacterium]